MLAFLFMLIESAKQAGMEVPPDPNNFDSHKYPHFQVFCNAQLCRRMSSLSQHWENAKVIAAIPESEILTVTFDDLVEKGFEF